MSNSQKDKQRLLNYFKQHISDRWFEKYYGALMCPIFVQGYYAVVGSDRNSRFAMAHGMFFQNWTSSREFDWMWNIEEMKNGRQKLFRELERDNTFGQKFYEDYLKNWKKFDLAVKGEELIDYKKLSSEELRDHLLNLIKYGEGQAQGYVVDCLLSFLGEDWFESQVNKYSKHKSTKKELNILRDPTHRTFVNEAGLMVAKAACLKSKNKKIDKYLNELVKNYYWIENNYLKVNPKTKKQFLEEIDQIKDACHKYQEEKNRIRNNLKKKKEIYKKIKASKLLKAFVQMADDFTFIQDCRKQVVLRLNHFIFLHLKELASRLDFDQELIFYIVPSEFNDFLERPDKFIEIARERQRGCLVIFDKDGYAIFTRSELRDVDLSNFFKDYSKINQVKGTPACPGRVRGIARVILGSDQFTNLREGDVLITNQTTPDFVPLMKKAAAVVAEQGGVTSHAAIVSRELGVTCVVGAKDAMRIFKDGDSVEVDAERGVVKKL